jgi:hemoglobin
MPRRLALPLLLLAAAVSGCAEGEKANPLPSRFASRADASPDNLLDRLGGAAGLTAIVDRFAEHVTANEATGEAFRKRFQEGDVAGLKEKLTAQLRAVAEGTKPDLGHAVQKAHQGLGIQDADFDVMLADLRRALDDRNVAAADRDAFLGRLEKMRPMLVQRPE